MVPFFICLRISWHHGHLLGKSCAIEFSVFDQISCAYFFVSVYYLIPDHCIFLLYHCIQVQFVGWRKDVS